MKQLIVAYAMLFGFNICYSQLYFQNNSSEPVYVAYAMQNNGESNESWYTHGWYSCDPGETIQISSAVGLNENVYFYAKSHDGETVWGGVNRDGSVNFLIHPSAAFDIKNANLQYVKDDHPEYSFRSFRHITIPYLKTRYTIEIS